MAEPAPSSPTKEPSGNDHGVGWGEGKDEQEKQKSDDEEAAIVAVAWNVLHHTFHVEEAPKPLALSAKLLIHPGPPPLAGLAMRQRAVRNHAKKQGLDSETKRQQPSPSSTARLPKEWRVAYGSRAVRPTRKVPAFAPSAGGLLAAMVKSAARHRPPPPLRAAFDTTFDVRSLASSEEARQAHATRAAGVLATPYATLVASMLQEVAVLPSPRPATASVVVSSDDLGTFRSVAATSREDSPQPQHATELSKVRRHDAGGGSRSSRSRGHHELEKGQQPQAESWPPPKGAAAFQPVALGVVDMLLSQGARCSA